MTDRAPRPEGMNPATWVNGKQSVTGWWSYAWGADRFHITLKKRDRLTGDQFRHIVVSNDTPEWGNWKLVRARKEPTP